MVGFSQRSAVTSALNAYAAALANARAHARQLYDLSSGNPCEQGLGLPASRIAQLLTHPQLDRYQPEPFGYLPARQAVARTLAGAGFQVPAERIMLTASTSEAYGMLFKLLCDPGDAVLVPQPSYPLFDVLAQLEGVQLVPYSLRYDGDWHLDRDALERALAHSAAPVRAVLLVHPNNPTGSFLKRAELSLLAGLGLPLVSDEVFGEYAFAKDHARAESALEAAGDALVFRMAGLSKSLALPQLKLAYTAVAGPEALCSQACARLEHIADAYLSVASPVQLALPQLLAEGPAVRAAILARVTCNLTALRRALAHSAADVLRCEGGWYALVRLPALLSDEAWCLELLEQDSVLVQPGYFFDLNDATYLVLSLLAPEAQFAAAAKRLRARVEAHSPST